jgi:hypothetical protein
MSLSNNDDPIITIQLNEKIYRTLLTNLTHRSQWFNQYFEKNPQSTIVNLNEVIPDFKISDCAFANILDYLRGSDRVDPQYINEKRVIVDNDPVIHLDVGGQKFAIAKTLLCQSPYFEASLTYYNGEEIFIDRNPEKFQEILQYLIDPNYQLREDYYSEADYYNISFTKKSTDLQSYKLESLFDIKPYLPKISEYPSIYYNGNAQITYNKHVYRRCTLNNVKYVYHDLADSRELKSEDNTGFNFGEKFSFQIPKDVIPNFKNLYFVVEFDLMRYQRSSDYLNWIPYVEAMFFKHVDIHIQSDRYQNRSYDLTYNPATMYINNMIYHWGRQSYLPIRSCLDAGETNYMLPLETSTINESIPEPSNMLSENGAQSAYRRPSLQKMIIPFKHYFTETCPTFPNRILNTVNISFEINDLKNLLTNGTEIIANRPLIKSLKLVAKTLIMDNDENRRFDLVGHEYLMPSSLTKTIHLNETISLEYDIQLPKNPEDQTFESINSIFLYFVKDEEILPYKDPNFVEATVFVDNKPYYTLDRDLLDSITRYEPLNQYNIQNVYSLNLSERIVTADNKGSCLMLRDHDIRVHVRLMPKFLSSRLFVVFRGEHVLQMLP